MVDIPLKARVECTDGPCGESITVVVNPLSRQVTYVVVEDKTLPTPGQMMVPVDQVVESSRDTIRLDCSKADVAGMQPFVSRRYVQVQVPEPGYLAYDSVNMMPYVASMETMTGYSDEVHVPEGQVAIHRGTRVEATDGHVGTVGELVVNPQSGEITHFVLEEGHFLGKRELTLPLSTVDRVEGTTVYLKLDKKAIQKLPAVPLKRRYVEGQTQIELIARVFDDAQRADKALEFVEDLRRRKVFKILNAAVLVKDADGEVSVQDTRDIDPKQGRLLGVITGGLVGLVGGPVGAVLGALAGLGAGGLAGKLLDFGFSDKFLKNLEQYLQPGSSALILLVEDEWAVQASDALKDLGGVVLQQTLTDQLVQDLMQEVESES
ncbi:MAG: DUF1269 domain-containing protein [Anaerolineae bacterium]|jgi:uncharacterized membrane protein